MPLPVGPVRRADTEAAMAIEMRRIAAFIDAPSLRLTVEDKLRRVRSMIAKVLGERERPAEAAGEPGIYCVCGKQMARGAGFIFCPGCGARG